MKFGPETSELTGLICEHQIWHGQKSGTFSRISPDILDRFLQSFHHMKALYMVTMICTSFPIFKGRCHGNQIILRKCYHRRLIPLAFVALLLDNELQYDGLAVRVNSGDDRAILTKNLVNFCLLPLEITGLICVRLVWHGQKLAYIV